MSKQKDKALDTILKKHFGFCEYSLTVTDENNVYADLDICHVPDEDDANDEYSWLFCRFFENDYIWQIDVFDDCAFEPGSYCFDKVHFDQVACRR